MKNHIVDIPDNFEEMLDIASKISKNIPFLRVDLYNINGKIYFGETTFFPSSGFTPWGDNKTDLEIGEMLKLNKNSL